ncbi:hypothetical protein [Opacimonas viscosa]|uniref:Uncharacterized protein n=1 Tax=Opacimonas viscosa TaxID=2961944 RepID=A0AA41X300_9ALTE|nr:hypothetical protein [Opacimonas viscosa]MCP3428927.1 hypothetical protein [Opacimonas viscosa]
MSASENYCDKEKRNTKSIAVWTVLWLLSTAALGFGPKFIWDYHMLISLVLVWVNLFFGYKMVVANKQLLEDLDELQQKIMFLGMAFALGCTVVVATVLGLLEAIRLVDSAINPSTILFVTGITYLIGIAMAKRKYS